MQNNEEETLLAYIGQILAEDTEYPIDQTLLYARVGRNVVGPSIFKNMGNYIQYRSPDLDRLSDALLELWEAQTQNPKWAIMEYLIKDGRFNVSYSYDDEIDPDELWIDRRQRAVYSYFGEKPILYPQPGEEPGDPPIYGL